MVTRIISLNVQGLADILKRRIVFNYYRNRADILCLQETHSDRVCESIWEAEFGGKILFVHCSSEKAGVCIIFKRNIGYRIVKQMCDENGRYIICELESIDDPLKCFTLCNLYIPNRDNPNFFVELFKQSLLFAPDKVFVGDYNLVMDPRIDRKNSTYNNTKSLNVIKEVMDETALTEVWCDRNSDKTMFSWMRAHPTVQASRIDFVLTSIAIANCIKNITYCPGIKTNHLAMFIALDQLKVQRGSGY